MDSAAGSIFVSFNARSRVMVNTGFLVPGAPGLLVLETWESNWMELHSHIQMTFTRKHVHVGCPTFAYREIALRWEETRVPQVSPLRPGKELL